MVKYTLKAIRVNKNETQEQTAKFVGVSVETWANYEKGVTYPDVPILNNILNHFKITYDEIDFLCDKITVKQ